MTLSPALLDELVVLLAAELAPRVAAELRESLASTAVAESWRLLDVDEAAACVGRSTRWVRERTKRGELPFVRLDGGALAFELDDLRAFAQARRIAAAEPWALADRLQGALQPASVNGIRGPHQVHDRRVSP